MNRAPIDHLLFPVNKFIQNEITGGLLLFISTVIALVLANSPLAESYHHFWEHNFSIRFAGYSISNSLHHWVNDGLMAVFFFVIGLELKRELIGGELSNFRTAILPMAAAIGGMAFPAIIYLFFNKGTDGIHGWGVPMATDIAFALGVLYLLGKRVPLSLRVFLTALAIVDDIGVVLVIAFFYTSDISMISLGIGTCFMALLIGANFLGIRSALFYGIVGIGGLWLAFLLSGVHATIAGILAAFAIPAVTQINEKRFINRLKNLTAKFMRADPNNNRLITAEQMHIIDEIKSFTLAAGTPLQQLEHRMQPLVVFVIMPIFALANAGITISGDVLAEIKSPVALGVIFGLLLGKFIGIAGFSRLMVYLKWAELPAGANWRQLYGVAVLASIGFTMSLFITDLAFTKPEYALQAKLGILVASVTGGATGYLILRKKRKKTFGNF